MYGVTKLDVNNNIVLVSFKKMPAGLDVLSDIFSRFADKNVVIDMVSQSSPMGRNVDVSFTCPDNEMLKVLEIVKELREKHPQLHPTVSGGNCKILLFGEEIRSKSGVFAKMLACLAGTQAEIHQISTSETDISLLIGAAHLDEAKDALLKAFGL